MTWDLQLIEIKQKKFPIFRAAIESIYIYIYIKSFQSSLSIEPPNNCRLVSRPRNLNVNIGHPSISETIEAYNTSGFHRSYEEKCERSSIPGVRPPNERSDPAANWLKTILPTVIIIPRRGTNNDEARVPNVARDLIVARGYEI